MSIKEETAETEFPPEPFCAESVMAMQHVKIQKKRFFIDGLINLRNAPNKSIITAC